MANQRLCLVDGFSYVFRAFHAVRGLTTRDGLATNALFGYLNMLTKVLKDLNPDYLAVALESRTPLFRLGIYPEYKATRPPAPPELKAQIPLVEPLTRALGIPVLQADGYEADDVIATMTDQARRRGLDVVIVSADKDLMQLVDGQVVMFDTGRDKWYRPEDVTEKMGVPPSGIRDLLAIMGDSSDNVPGVRGIGAKGAAKLIQDYGSLDGIYASLSEVKPPRTQDLLREHRDSAVLSQRLVSLAFDVPLDVAPEHLVRAKPDREALIDLYTKLEFRSQLRELLPASGPAASGGGDLFSASSSVAGVRDSVQSVSSERTRAAASGTQGELVFGIRSSATVEHSGDSVVVGSGPGGMPEPVVVTDRDALDALVHSIQARGRVSLDTETTSVNSVRAGLVGIAASTGPDNAWYIPIAHVGHAGPQLPLAMVRDALSGILADGKIGIIGQNFKFDLVVLRQHGFRVKGLVFDTMLASYLLDPGRASHSMDHLAAQLLGIRTTSYKEVTRTLLGEVTFDRVPVDQAARYSGEDAWVTWMLMEKMAPEVEAQKLGSLLADVEIPLSEVLAEMERTGICVDVHALGEMSREFQGRLMGIERQIYDLAGSAFNINSPKQLAAILFDRLGLTPGKKTKSGFSTDVAVLEDLALVHPLPAEILNYRTLTKLKSTYVDVLPKLVNPASGRVHTSFNQAVAATGRLSSSDPNLQNIPIRGEEGKRIREAFVPGAGKVFVAADYSQIELRILAHLSEDPALIEAFRQGADIHSRTAAELFRVQLDQVSSDMRRVAKTINFGVLYGMSAFRLAREQKIPQRDAKAFIDRYFSRYPGIHAYTERCRQMARDKGYVETLLGRKRFIPQVRSGNAQERASGERMAVNSPVQGGAADVVKMAMVKLARRLEGAGFPASLLLQVHDELMLETAPEHVHELQGILTDVMESAMELKVPLKVDCRVGKNWAESHG